MSMYFVRCFRPCLKVHGSWFAIRGISDRALEQAHTRLVASRETERSALLEVVPEAVRKDSELLLTDFHRVGQRV